MNNDLIKLITNNNRSGIFVTGTGTDVGKTYASALILKKLRENGVDAGYFKPALSGAYYDKDVLIPGDAEYVCQISGISRNPSELVSYMFRQAVSPHLAARLNNTEINQANIMQKYKQLSNEYEFLLIEGAGGIACPFRMGENPLMLIDVIKQIGLDIIIVAESVLGTINSTVLTVEYAKQHNVKIIAIIMNKYDQNNEMHVDNKKSIEQLTGEKVFAIS